MTYADAINAGLKTELMTVVIQPDPPAPSIMPTVLSGSYRFGTREKDGKFCGYEFKINQDELTASSISGKFITTEEFMKFAKDLKDSGATLKLVDDFVGTVKKHTAGNAIAQGLIFDIREGDTTVEGRFEIFEGVITIYQKPFKLVHESSVTYGAFINANELLTFLNDCWEDLQKFDKVQRMWARKNNRYFDRFYPVKFLK